MDQPKKRQHQYDDDDEEEEQQLLSLHNLSLGGQPAAAALFEVEKAAADQGEASKAVKAAREAVEAAKKKVEEADASVAFWSNKVQELFEKGDFEVAFERVVEQQKIANAALVSANAALGSANAALKDREVFFNARDAAFKEEKNRLQQAQQPVPQPPVSFAEAFASLNIKLPDTVAAFEPKLVQLPASHRFAASVAQAGVLGKFTDPAEPDFLLTEMMRAPASTDDMRKLEIGPLGELTEGSARRLVVRTLRGLVLVGASGAGKTLYTYQLATRTPTLLFTCVTQGNGGSGEMAQIIAGAELMYTAGHHEVDIVKYVELEVRKAVSFRVELYKQCVAKYGADKFLPRHWAMAQLYSAALFGGDLFLEFQELNVDRAGMRHHEAGSSVFSYIVLDEAQRVDGTLQNVFTSLTDPTARRSLLSPLVKSVITLKPKLVVCGTGLSGGSVLETTASPIKSDVGSALVGLSTFFDETKVRDALVSWGIFCDGETLRAWVRLFVGRPRHATFLAAGLIQGEVQPLFNELCTGYTLAWDTARRIDVEVGQRGSDPEIGGSLAFFVRYASVRWLLGEDGFLVEDAALAVRYGLASLAEVAGTKRCVVREPVLLMTILGNDPAKYLELPLVGSDAKIGLDFECILALRAQGVVQNLSMVLSTFKPNTMAMRRPQAASTVAQAAEFKREWIFSFPDDYAKQFVIRAYTAGDDMAWLRQVLNTASPPPDTVCFPSTAMGPDVIICAHNKDNPKERLVVLIQCKTGRDESTPETMRSLRMLYWTNRGKNPGEAKGENGTTDDVEALLKMCKVVRMVVKPMNGSNCDAVEVTRAGVMEIVLDKREADAALKAKMFPCLAKAVMRVLQFKGQSSAATAARNKPVW